MSEYELPPYHVDPDGTVCRHEPHTHFTVKELCEALNDVEQKLGDAYMYAEEFELSKLMGVPPDDVDPDVVEAVNLWIDKLQIVMEGYVERGIRVKDQKPLSWGLIEKHRSGHFDALPEEEKIGTGRTTTMLVDMLEYVKRVAPKFQPGVSVAVVVVPLSRFKQDFKDKVRHIAKELDMVVLREEGDSMNIDGVNVFFVTPAYGMWRGRGEVFVDHGVGSVEPGFHGRTGLKPWKAGEARGESA